jgi:hypothetical protein
MILSPLDKEQVARRHTCKRAGRRRLKRAGGAGSKQADPCPRPMEGQVANRQTYAKGQVARSRPMPQTYGGAGSKQNKAYAKGQVARSRLLPLLCPSYASYAFACNSKHAFFLFHIFDARGAQCRQFILHKHIHHLSCHVSSYVSQKEVCTSMRVPVHMRISHTKDASGRVSSGYCREKCREKCNTCRYCRDAVIPWLPHFLLSLSFRLFVCSAIRKWGEG